MPNGCEWQEAQERVLLYLKILGVDPLTSLEVARRALDDARRRQGGGGGGCALRLSMAALHDLLRHDAGILAATAYGVYPLLLRRWQIRKQGPWAGGGEPVAVPPISRGSMRTRKL